MVVIEPGDRNVNKQSETSIYSATVSEQLGFSQSEDMTISEDQDLATDVGEKFEEGTETTRKEEDEANFSVLDEDNTLVFGQDAIPDDDKSADGDASQEQDLSINNSGGQPGSGEKQLEDEPNAQVIPLHDPILTAASEAKSGNAKAGDIPQDSETFDPAEVAAVISKCQSSPMNITKADIFYLVDLLRQRNPELHSAVLDCLIRIAAFTHNIANIRESGCPEVIVQQVQEYCLAVTSGDGKAEKTLNSVCQVLTNLSMDPKTQEELGDAIPALIDLIQIRPFGDAIILSALRPLVNLSSEKTYHKMYRNLIPTLYQLLESGTHMAKVQSLKVLVNLSLDEDVVPYLLAAKAPPNLIEFLDRPTANDLILRAVTLIANIHTVIDTLQLTAASLPVDEKAASPETMYMALTGIDRLPTLRSKVFRLTRHEDEDVVYQASKLYNLISEPSA
ncbi:unnamed protein product [Lymnaea stagnalis]|uniref:Armadillo repeat-containing domain-containing protein n=1 Tax=Lymnaea stagnalis TaxID=6523 RepID=A0AAV2HF51_LYMST